MARRSVSLLGRPYTKRELAAQGKGGTPTRRKSRAAESKGFYRVNVSSSCVTWVGYDPDTRTLRIKFETGGLYDYDGVHPNTVTALVKAGSVGRAFWRLIRDRHNYSRVG